MGKLKPKDVETRKEPTLYDLHDRIEAWGYAIDTRLGEALEHLSASRHRLKYTALIMVAIVVGWDLLKAWLF